MSTGRSKSYTINTGEFLAIPEHKIFPGTFTSSGKIVTGVGTDFIRDLLTGGRASGQLLYPWLIDLFSVGQIVTISHIVSPTVLHLKTAFSTNIAVAQNLAVSGPSKGSAKRFGFTSADITFCLLDDVPVSLTAMNDFFKNSGGIPPMVIKAGASQVSFTVDY